MSTQSTHPWRASLRTGGAVAVSGLSAAAVAGPVIAEFVNEQFPGTPVAAATVGVVGFVAGLSVLVNRVALLGPVADFFTKIGLGATPKDGEA